MAKTRDGNPAVTTVKDATFALMRAFKIDKVFGNPGSTELSFLADWPDDIEYVLGLQEASVIGMADGYAQATGNAAFVNLHSAAGVGHALGNIHTAYRNHTPMVITAGQQARSLLPMQAFLSADRASEFPRPYVKYSIEPARAADVPHAIARAYYTAMQPPYGPTFVSIPSDDWLQPSTPIQPRRFSRELGPDPMVLMTIARAISASKRPALVIGADVDRANAVDLVVTLAEASRAAVWVAPFAARAVFPERHPQFAGFLHASPGQLSDALKHHDVVVVIGAPAFTFHVEGHAAIFDGDTELFQITSDPSDAMIAPVGTALIATMRPALAALTALLPSSDRPLPPARALPPPPTSAHPIPVEYLLHRLHEAMPDNAILVEEAPSHRPAIQKYMPMRGGGSFYTMASGGLGHSLPAAVGLAIGKPNRRTVCLIGDGSTTYSIQALWTAAQRKLPLTVVVINNGGYGAMRSFSQVMQVRNVPGIELQEIDFVKLAEGFGCHAIRVDKAEDLDTILANSLRYPGVSLVEVIVDSAVPLLYARK